MRVTPRWRTAARRPARSPERALANAGAQRQRVERLIRWGRIEPGPQVSLNDPQTPGQRSRLVRVRIVPTHPVIIASVTAHAPSTSSLMMAMLAAQTNTRRSQYPRHRGRHLRNCVAGDPRPGRSISASLDAAPHAVARALVGTATPSGCPRPASWTPAGRRGVREAEPGTTDPAGRLWRA